MGFIREIRACPVVNRRLYYRGEIRVLVSRVLVSMRISGINIPDNKRIEYSLPYIYGIGLSSAKLILKSANISSAKKTKDLTPEEVNKIQNIIEKSYKVEGDLRREVGESIKRMKEVGTWRGVRHARRLPVHGRTRVNSRTLRGNVRKTMGSGRKSATEKT